MTKLRKPKETTPKWLKIKSATRRNPSRRNSVRKSEKFHELKEFFQEAVTMGDRDETIPLPPSTHNSEASGSNEALHNSPPGYQAPPHNSDDANAKAEAMKKIIEERVKPMRILAEFSKKTVVSRKMLAGIQSTVTIFTQLKDSDARFSILHSDWLDCCGKNEEQLEEEQNPLRPSEIDPKFEASGAVLDNAEEVFKLIKQQYPSKVEVIDYLDFVDKLPGPVNKGGSVLGSQSDNRSETAGLGKGEQYVKDKIPKLKSEFESRFQVVKENFESEKATSEHSLQQLYMKLQDLERKLEEDSLFENLLKELYLIPDLDQEEFRKHEEWLSTNKALVETLMIAIDDALEKKKGEKISEMKLKQESKSSFATFFKKQDPPRFKGDCVEYLEFKRKWNSQVSSNKPPTEFELDLLKKMIPEEGKQKLYGVESLSSAWLLLDKQYGDERLICQKLKTRLKNLKPKATEPHEVIIEINNEIEYLVKRLRDLGAQDLLYFDNEYLNNCYKHLPSPYQYDWDKFNSEEFTNPWIAFMSFMSEMSRSALKKRALVESLKDMDSQVPERKSKGGKSIDTLAVKTDIDIDPVKVAAQKSFNDRKVKIGACKICNEFHTYHDRKTGRDMPSDRFYICEKFKAMTSKQKAQMLEKFGSCSRCTSWMHKKSQCRAPVLSCKEKIDGAVCGLDHSKVVCGSGVSYCNLTVNTKHEPANDEKEMVFDENAPTISYLQDVPVAVRNSTRLARTLWDGGSNRALINNDFAMENNLVAKDTSIATMKLAAGEKKRLNVKLYDWKFVARDGTHHHLWGYGIDTILEADEPVDPGPVRDLFSHIPQETFKQLQKRRIDILVGINYNSLFPTGGEGIDSVGNLKVMKTKFGSSGWILGGTHEKLKPPVPRFSSAAAEIRVARIEIIPDEFSS